MHASRPAGYADFTLTVEADGTVVVDPPAGFAEVSGQTVTIKGYRITLDTRTLSHDLRPLLLGWAGGDLSPGTHAITLVPGKGYACISASGIVADFTLTVEADGTVVVDPPAGFAEVSGQTVTIKGYRITLDTRTLSHDLRPLLLGWAGGDLSPGTHAITLVPGKGYACISASGIVADFTLTVEADGTVVVDPPAGFAEVSGQTVTIKGYRITLDTRTLSHDLRPLLLGWAGGDLSPGTHAITLVPGKGYTFQSLAGVTGVIFTLDVAGRLRVDPRFAGFAYASGRMLIIGRGPMTDIDSSTLALLRTLAGGVRAIRAEHAVPDDPGAMSEEVLRQKLGLVLSPDVVERFLAMMNGTVEFTATKAIETSSSPLKPEGFTDEPAIREVRYNATRREQKLTFRGVLFDAEKSALMARLPKPVTPNQHVESPLLGELLNDVQRQAKSFFKKHLQKQAPNVQPAYGFLDGADFDLLFDKNLALADGETPQYRLRKQRTRLAQTFLPFLQQRLIRQFIVQTMTAHTGADPVLVESLLTDERLLGETQPAGASQPLLAAFTAAGEGGLTVIFFASPNGSGAALATSTFADVDTGLKDKDGKPLKPAAANSARFEGYLAVPAPGAYRFYVALDKRTPGPRLVSLICPIPCS